MAKNEYLDKLCILMRDRYFNNAFVYANFTDEDVEVAHDRLKQILNSPNFDYKHAMQAFGKYVYILLKNNMIDELDDLLDRILELAADELLTNIFELMRRALNKIYGSEIQQHKTIKFGFNGSILSIQYNDQLNGWVIVGEYNGVEFVASHDEHDVNNNKIFIGYFSVPIEAIHALVDIDLTAYFACHDDKIKQYAISIGGELFLLDVLNTN